MSFPRWMFIDPEQYEKHQCSICFNLITNAVTDRCAQPHTFCSHCIYPWLYIDQRCPISRVPVTYYQMSRDMGYDLIVSQSVFLCCPFKKCGAAVTMDQLADHMSSCDKNNLFVKTKLVSGGFFAAGRYYEDNFWTNFNRMGPVRIHQIVLRFIRTIESNWDETTFDSLSSIRFRYIRDQDDRVIDGSSFGGEREWLSTTPVVEHIMTFAKGERITSITLDKGSVYFPSITICTNLCPKGKFFGFEGLTTLSEKIEIPEGWEVTGLFGYFGYVVDKLGFFIGETAGWDKMRKV